jgi:hypothetical protein
MMKRYAVFIIALVIITTGCTHRPIPLATSYPLSAQRRMQAAHHWDVLAENVAERLKKTMDLTFVNAPTPPPIYIKTDQDLVESPFGRVFDRLLTNQLIKQGLIVLESQTSFSPQGYTEVLNYQDALVIDYDMQVVYHEDRRATYPFPGTLTALAGGIYWIAHGIDQWEHQGAAAFPLAIAGDALAMKHIYMPGETNAEVVITTMVTMNNQKIFGDTGIYYINAGDDEHYLYKQSGSGKTYSIIGCQAGPCL